MLTLANRLGMQAESQGLIYIGRSPIVTTAGNPNLNLSGIGLQPGDLVVAVAWNTRNSGNTYTVTTAGWTLMFNRDQNGVNGACALGGAYKLMGATPDTSVKFNTFNFASGGGVAYAFRGVDQTTPIDTTPDTNGNNSSAIINPGPTASPQSAGCAVFVAGVNRRSIGFNASLSAPTDFEDFVQGSNGGDNYRAGAAWRIVEAAGTFDPPAFGGGDSAGAYVACTVPIRPA